MGVWCVVAKSHLFMFIKGKKLILVGKCFCLETGNWVARALAVGYAGGIVIQLTNKAPSFGKK